MYIDGQEEYVIDRCIKVYIKMNSVGFKIKEALAICNTEF
jgi:hypothetical protein